MKLLIATLVTAASLSLFTNNSWSMPIVTWEYSFLTTGSSGTLPINSSLEGTLVEGHFQYEVDIQNRTGSGGKQYQLISSSVEVDGIALATGVTNLSGNTANRVRVYNDLTSGSPDLISLSQTVNQSFEGYILEAVGLVFFGDSIALNSYDLTPDLFDLPTSVQGRLSFTKDGVDKWFAFGDVSINRVSEPSLLGLIVSGLAGLVFARRRKQQA